MIVLADKIRIIQPYDGKSKFDFWKDMKKGDVLVVAMELKFTGKYKPELVITNERTGKKFYESLNMIHKYLGKTTYESYVLYHLGEVEDRSVSDETKNMLVRWLADEYIYTEAKEMIRDAYITEWNGKITITYPNGLSDVVTIKNNKVIQLS